jgi:biopolymer transport protein TolR
MQVGGSGGMQSQINVTPLVDVVLVLLIIFMVMTPVVQMGYLVRVPPKAPPGTPLDVMSDQIVIRYTSTNRVLINKDEMSPEEFPRRMAEILKGNTSKMVFFAGDPEVDYEKTMQFLDLARSAGAHNIGIIVDDMSDAPPAEAAPGS